ncbi:MAG: hypothetical protein A2V65_01635 [Deltaproteobacteria bacterium RBG_13_49_15]|nr:MAG: hypothetical protein A2V65_01635 [Deltaproteobacteria bacterium RBG_13_49_15]
MKKAVEEKKVVREELEGITPRDDYTIEREIQEDGSVHYHHPLDDDNPEPVRGESLYEVIMTPIRRVEALVELLDDEDHARFGFLAQGITEAAERLYGEVFHFLDEVVGHVEMDVMGNGSVVYRNGRVVGARIKAPSPKEGA